MQTILYAATSYGYCVQVIDGGEIVYEYTAGNHQRESQTFVDPRSPNAVRPSQLKRWAKQTADQIAEERGVPLQQSRIRPRPRSPIGCNSMLMTTRKAVHSQRRLHPDEGWERGQGFRPRRLHAAAGRWRVLSYGEVYHRRGMAERR